MRLENFLQKQAQKLSLENCEIDERGVCRIPIDKDITIIVESPPEEEGFFIYAPICLLPKRGQQKVELLTEFLKGNLFGLKTGGSVLAYDSRAEVVILFKHYLQDDMKEEVYMEEFNLFVKYVRYWRKKSDERAKTSKKFNEENSQMRYLRSKGMRIFIA